MNNILSKQSGQKILMLGNEAIVRGALESGINFVSTYPGTPASEIGNIFSQIAKKVGVYFEFSVNEKVALEAGIGASFSGLKTLVAMKSFGLNVALDSLLPLAYTGSKGPMVLIVADDPNCWSSAQSEENSRAFAYLSHIPILEPSDPQECKDFTKLGFEISEKFKIPVIIRTTTRVAHQSAPVILDKIQNPKSKIQKGIFIRDQKRFVTMPPRVLEMKKELLHKIENIKEFSEKSPINKIENQKLEIRNCPDFVGDPDASREKLGIITSGISYLYVREALNELKLALPILKLSFFYPLPEKKIQNFIKNFKKVLVVEELEPYLQKEIERLVKNVNPKLQIFGKNLLPEIGELKPEYVISAIAKLTNTEYQIQNTRYKIQVKHLPRFCPGCPYWSVFTTIKKIAPKNTVFGGDIGCYMLSSVSPHNLYDYLSSMGSSIGIAHGIKKSTNQKVIAFIGDSTFFHAGIPALINIVFNKSNPLIIILDNGTTAMTGRQPHPGTSVRTDSEYKFEWEGYLPNLKTAERPIRIEDIITACGVKNLKVVNSFNPKEIEKAIKELLPQKEISVIIARGICALLAKSLK